MGRRLAGSYGLPPDAQEDIEQNLALSVILALPRFDPVRGTDVAFITGVIRNKVRKIIEEQKAACRDYRRRGGSLQDPIQIDPDSDPIERGESCDLGTYLWFSRGEPDPEETADLRLDLDRAAETLPRHLQTMLRVLRLGLSDTESARYLGISRETFYQRRRKLGQHLQQAGISDYLHFPPDTLDTPPVGDE
jgi:RNA polymerase sigma factor (sigma-70 family)